MSLKTLPVPAMACLVQAFAVLLSQNITVALKQDWSNSRAWELNDLGVQDGIYFLTHCWCLSSGQASRIDRF